MSKQLVTLLRNYVKIPKPGKFQRKLSSINFMVFVEILQLIFINLNFVTFEGKLRKDLEKTKCMQLS